MPPDNQLNVGGGRFGEAIGGGDALRAALQRRNIDPALIEQVSNQAPTGPSNLPAPVPQGAPNVSLPPDQSLQTSSQAQEGNFRSGEMQVALQALADVVKTEQKIARDALNVLGGGV